MDEAVRIADEKIYLNEDRYDAPKESFKHIVEYLKNIGFSGNKSLCDIGCATGEFLYYVTSVFEEAELHGVDVIEKFIERAQNKLPQAQLNVGSINEKGILPESAYDVITMQGVLNIFENIAPTLSNCLAAIKEGGDIIIFSPFNENPIDVVMKYKRSDEKDSVWESGHNIHSCFSIEKFFKESNYGCEITWHNFRMPFALEKGDNPMRSWTIPVGDEKNFTVNGANQLLDQKILHVRVNSKSKKSS